MKALRATLIVAPVPLPTVQGGIHLVERHHPSPLARVVAIGPEIARQWPELQPGHQVAIRPMGGQDFEHAGCRLKRMTREDVLAFVEDEAQLTLTD